MKQGVLFVAEGAMNRCYVGGKTEQNDEGQRRPEMRVTVGREGWRVPGRHGVRHMSLTKSRHVLGRALQHLHAGRPPARYMRSPGDLLLLRSCFLRTHSNSGSR